jgi:hypothetical protein
MPKVEGDDRPEHEFRGVAVDVGEDARRGAGWEPACPCGFEHPDR